MEEAEDAVSLQQETVEKFRQDPEATPYLIRQVEGQIGWANDYAGASAANPGGYALGMWIFSVLGFLGFFFAWMLRREETGPNAHGLETITVKSTREAAARAQA